jgi:hypothetical protein
MRKLTSISAAIVAALTVTTLVAYAGSNPPSIPKPDYSPKPPPPNEVRPIPVPPPPPPPPCYGPACPPKPTR